MTSNLTEIRARLRELLANAMPGEWMRRDQHIGGQHCSTIIVGNISQTAEGKSFASTPEGDCELIAESHNALPALLDEIDRLERMIELADICGYCNGQKRVIKNDYEGNVPIGAYLDDCPRCKGRGITFGAQP